MTHQQGPGGPPAQGPAPPTGEPGDAAHARERIDAAAREVETQAHGAIVRINRARDQAEEAERLHRDAEEKARQAAREAEHALHKAREMSRRLREVEQQQQTWEAELAELAEGIRQARQKSEPAMRRGEAPASPPAPPSPPPEPPRLPADLAQVDEPPVPPAVELIPDDPLAGNEGIVKASVRSETPRERLARALEQVLSVKQSVAEALGEAADDAFDRAAARPLREQRDLTQLQIQELEERLRGLGGEPPAGRSVFRRLIAWAWDGWRREPDDLDRTAQAIWKAMAGQSLEMAMCQWLAPLARGLGDEVTARLAERHWRQKEGAVTSLRPILVPLAQLTARMGEVAQVVRRPLEVEAEVVPAEEANGHAKKS